MSSITVVGPTGSLAGLGHIEFLELDLLRPDLFQEILKDGDGQKLPGAAPISKTERRKPLQRRKRRASDVMARDIALKHKNR